MSDGLVEKTRNTGLDAGAEEHAGECCPFLTGLLNVFVDRWPIAVVGGHDASERFEGGDLLQGFASDGDDCGAGSAVAGVGKAALLGEAASLAVRCPVMISIHCHVGYVHVAQVASREGGATLLMDA